MEKGGVNEGSNDLHSNKLRLILELTQLESVVFLNLHSNKLRLIPSKYVCVSLPLCLFTFQ